VRVLLPLYDPLRLIEEVCMLDHLSRGRFDFGVGAASCRTRWPTSTSTISRRRRSTGRALEVILQGLTSDVLEHRGPRYTYRKVPMILRPLQQPHPPLWYGLGHAARAPSGAADEQGARHHQQPE